jgi:predicted unusual protein kinase regulating ubiquinone biosynthesis (AarF/ABC1/UbiB family)
MNLFVFLIKIIEYKLSRDKKSSILDIKNILSSAGPIWQKFGQVLSYQEELIGEELASELQTLLVKCPSHSHEYSAKIIKEMFGDKYNVNNINDASLLGSGTIAQVYRIDEIVIKILHPNVEEEIKRASDKYDSIKNSFFFPKKLTMFCDFFFKSLFEQIDMEKEYNSGLIIKDLLNHDDNTELKKIFIFPQMIDYSKECIVMSYEESLAITLNYRDEIDKRVLFKTCMCIVFFQLACVQKGFIHADMHYGNFGVRNSSCYDDMKIVVYDFGLMLDIRDTSQQLRNDISRALAFNDSLGIASLILKNNNNYDNHMTALKKIFTFKHFEKDLERLGIYVSLHSSIKLDKNIILILASCEKCKAFHTIALEIVNTPNMGEINNMTQSKDIVKMMEIFDNYLAHNEFISLKKIVCT